MVLPALTSVMRILAESGVAQAPPSAPVLPLLVEELPLELDPTAVLELPAAPAPLLVAALPLEPETPPPVVEEPCSVLFPPEQATTASTHAGTKNRSRPDEAQR
jgi:hypothetical protein